MEPTKSFASLCPTLLARKGGARPAMRPQTSGGRFGDSLARNLDDEFHHDLGWNDFGAHAADDDQAEFQSDSAEVVSINGDGTEPAATIPAVVRQRKAAEKRIAVGARAPRSRRSALEAGRKAAFTLRLDAERHLKLRLACTVDARSAQQLVTEALDRLLAAMPEIDALADHVGKQRKT